VGFFLRHSLSALQAQKRGKNGIYVFALAYSGCQTVVYSRNVICNTPKNGENIDKINTII
jgi:hypothetical protein